MRQIVTRARWLLIGVLLPLTILTLWAQEPKVEQRGINVLRGNVVIGSGVAVSGGGPSRDFRTNTSITTDGAVTYTAAQVLTGLIQRTMGPTGAATDVLPTAANLIAAMPGVTTGHSFWLLVDMGATPNATMTLNGASTGVTYSGGCATAQSTLDAMLVLINITSSTTYRAVCLNVNT